MASTAGGADPSESLSGQSSVMRFLVVQDLDKNRNNFTGPLLDDPESLGSVDPSLVILRLQRFPQRRHGQFGVPGNTVVSLGSADARVDGRVSQSCFDGRQSGHGLRADVRQVLCRNTPQVTVVGVLQQICQVRDNRRRVPAEVVERVSRVETKKLVVSFENSDELWDRRLIFDAAKGNSCGVANGLIVVAQCLDKPA